MTAWNDWRRLVAEAVARHDATAHNRGRLEGRPEATWEAYYSRGWPAGRAVDEESSKPAPVVVDRGRLTTSVTEVLPAPTPARRRRRAEPSVQSSPAPGADVTADRGTGRLVQAMLF